MIKQILLKKPNLTPKQQKFALCYAYTNNRSLALLKADLVAGTGTKMMRNNPQVVLYINLLRQLMILLYIAQYLFCVMLYKQILKRAKEEGDYALASSIILKISKLREPMQLTKSSSNNEIKIIIGTL